MICFPNAKINLGLDILKKRSDNFHDIETCLVGITLCDVMEIKESDSFNIEIFGEDIGVETEGNIIFSLWVKLKRRFSLPAFRIKLLKNIPSGAGLGGGSSDAAFFIKEINKAYKLEMNDSQMQEFLVDIGSDSPFFVGNNISLATSKGDVLKPIEYDKKLESTFVTIVVPQKRINTTKAYENISPKRPKLPINDLISLPMEHWKYHIKNDFEEYVLGEIHELSGVRDSLYKEGAIYVSLTGSGSGMFSLSEKELNLETLPKDYFIWSGRLIF
ncbi:MAG: 4-(cytidine 5'-diphospho)-2-C-methyl-D-erythritol kinase [Marinilabiliales bacterium]|nr:MAG: 4-(cytidine 5'-diphospho)-2-C-methyl-D-erythritol kinase [Marinilabiliales bacterium]